MEKFLGEVRVRRSASEISTNTTNPSSGLFNSARNVDLLRLISSLLQYNHFSSFGRVAESARNAGPTGHAASVAKAVEKMPDSVAAAISNVPVPPVAKILATQPTTLAA